MSPSKFVRVMKHYGILTGDLSRAKASLAFLQTLQRPKGLDRDLSARRGSSGMRRMTFTEFCQTIILLAQKRFPGRRAMKAMNLILKFVHNRIVKDARDRSTNRKVLVTLSGAESSAERVLLQ
mmetsp:Transcript_10224/g.19656  ORF Transcript_10224/g.19656 Transcript_10224/m.19656 type:complete len:123 (-) Transcript_10224:29-397(-)